MKPPSRTKGVYFARSPVTQHVYVAVNSTAVKEKYLSLHPSLLE
jgi:hypothetical protein